jgi:hypothetical protein
MRQILSLISVRWAIIGFARVSTTDHDAQPCPLYSEMVLAPFADPIGGEHA